MSVALFGACGGESGLSPDGPGSEAGEAGQGHSNPNPPGDAGAAGEWNGSGGSGGDTSPGTGGIGKGAAPGTGGTGGTVGRGGAAPGTGGKATAGSAPVGGGKGMPEAGSPNIPDPPEPPEGCQPQSISSSINDCSIQLQCGGNQYVFAYCGNPGTGGPWNCQCEGSGRIYQQYTISGVTGSAACTAIAAFCASGEEPDPGPEECSDLGSSRSASYCSVNETCIRPFDIGDGIQAGLASTAYTSCSSNGTGTQQCSCQPDQFTAPIQFQVSGQDGTTACDTVMDLCGGDIEGELVCTPQSSSGAVGYCDSQMQCSKTSEVEEGVFATVQDYRFVSCSGSGARSMCNCSNSSGRYTRFDVDMSTDGALCSRVSDACDASAVDLSGPITCAPASQSASGGYCNAQIDCKQAGTVGDLEIEMYGTLSADCQVIDGKWTCNCYSGRDNERIEVDADSEWDACSAAVQQCPDVVEVKIGESNGGIFPPGFPVPVPF